MYKFSTKKLYKPLKGWCQLALTLSILALLATFYQSYLQRVHNQKSVKPLVQVDLIDNDSLLAVHVRNNGIGPYIIKGLNFQQNGRVQESIEDCLLINPRLYQSVPVTPYTPKTVLPGSSLVVFSMQCTLDDTECNIEAIRKKLSVLTLTVKGVDIYDNQISVKRSFEWFQKFATKVVPV